MLAAATMMLAACAETDLVNEIAVEETPQAISFETFANKATRAEITQTSDLQTTNGGFHVWGYKNRGNEAEYTVFDNIPVSWVAQDEDVAAHWGYDDPQYWDKTATYKFYAAAPKSSNYSISNKLITVNNVTSGKSTDVTDYLIDRDGVTNVNGALKQPVQFDFNHIMAKLSFKFKAGVNENITITSLKMTGWDAGAGTFTQNTTDVPTTVAHTEWNIATPNIADGNECVIIDNNPLSGVNSTTAIDGGYSYIMVPQTITHSDAIATNDTPEKGLTFTISYTIINDYVDDSTDAITAGNDPKDEVFINQVGILPTDQVWGTDTHTTYTIIVSPTKIEFGDPTIEDWSVEDGDGDDDDDDDTQRAEDELPL